ETTLQKTRYWPGASAGRLTSNRFLSLGLTRGSSRSPCRLSASSTRRVLKPGSIAPSNQMRTAGGDASTVWPTRGSEGSGDACPQAGGPGGRGTPAAQSGRAGCAGCVGLLCREHAVQRRPREELGRDVVQVEVHLPDPADVLAGSSV